MALYHFSTQVFSRSQQKSSVAAAAYRACDILQDERLDKNWDYRKKEGLLHQEIMAPPHTPDNLKKRETLWNNVEHVEKRCDAQLAREFEIALPIELTLDQNKALIREFVQSEFVNRGMIADLCLHGTDKNNPNPHAHVLTTLRTVTTDGFGKKERSWNGKALLYQWREEWANVCNKHLALNGVDERIDHRSYKDQGVDLEPQHKRGNKATETRSKSFEDHQRIANDNAQRLLADPNIAIHALTFNKATFTERDVACFVNRHTLSTEQFQQVLAKIMGSDQLLTLGTDDRGQTRYTSVEMFETEKKLMKHAIELSRFSNQRPAKKESLENLEKRFEKLTDTLNPEQKIVFENLVADTRLKCVVGYAGTGKSYVLGKAREAWETQGFRVRGAALAGRMVESLQSGSGIDSRTLHSHLYRWKKGEDLLAAQEVFVVDEAGLLGTRQIAELMDAVHQAGATLVLIGDTQQLQSIEAGAAFRAITEQVYTVELTQVIRQTETWQREATRQMASGRVSEAFSAYEAHGMVHASFAQEEAVTALVSHWNDVRITNPTKSQLILAYTRDEVKQLNEKARAIRLELGEILPGTVIQTERGPREFSVGDRVTFLRGDYGIGVRNGTLGTVEKVNSSELVVLTDEGEGQPKRIEVNLAVYNALEHGYASTIHKAQGATVDHAYVLTSPYFDAHSTYVSLSRHRERVEVFHSEERFPNRDKLLTTLNRDRSKDMSIDYIDSQSLALPSSRVYRSSPSSHSSYSSPFDAPDNPHSSPERIWIPAYVRASFTASAPEQKSLTAEQIEKVKHLIAQYADLHELAKKDPDPLSFDQRNLQYFCSQLIDKPNIMGYIQSHYPNMAKNIPYFAKQREAFVNEHLSQMTPEQLEKIRRVVEKYTELQETADRDPYTHSKNHRDLHYYCDQIAEKPKMMEYIRDHYSTMADHIRTHAQLHRQRQHQRIRRR